MSKNNVTQIHRFDAKGVLMEILSSSFAIGKVRINIGNYNNNNKMTALNEYYFDFADWFALSQQIQNGTMYQKAMQSLYEAQQTNSYPKDIFTPKPTGTAKEKLKTKRTSGMDEARVFRIYPSNRDMNAVMVSIAKGDGERQKQGIIAPKFNTYLNKSDGNTVVCNIKVNYDELRGACQLVDARINAFIIAQQLAGAYEYIGQQKEETPVSQQYYPPTYSDTQYQQNSYNQPTQYDYSTNGYNTQYTYPQQVSTPSNVISFTQQTTVNANGQQYSTNQPVTYYGQTAVTQKSYKDRVG